MLDFEFREGKKKSKIIPFGKYSSTSTWLLCGSGQVGVDH